MRAGERSGRAAGARTEGARMLLRGRLTLLGLVALLLLLIDFAFFRADEEPPLPPLVADGGGAPEPLLVGPPPPALAPAELLTWLPFTRDRLEELEASTPSPSAGEGRLAEVVQPPASRPDLRGPLHIEYALDPELMGAAFRVLRQGRVALGHLIVMDPASGRVLAYASTDVDRFPPDRAYPAASLVKVITAAAALHHAPEVAGETCRYVGNPYRLTRKRLDPPRSGNSMSLRRALATSNNQCFAQLAVHRVGRRNLLGAIDRFGWMTPPAPIHPAGVVNAEDDPLELGKLGAGLSGSRITPLHAVQLASTLAKGRLVEPYWVERVNDGTGRPLQIPRGSPRLVMTPQLATELRGMLVDTTTRGTARRAFRTRRGPLLGPVRVAGKTGSLSGRDPDGRYEWFVGVAPAEAPTVAVAVLLVQGRLWWVTPAQVAAEFLKVVFCPKGVCDAQAAEPWLESDDPTLEAALAVDVATPG